MDSIISNNLEDTLRIGEAWGQQATAGWVIGLDGDLGAGKTHLVKGIARGMGIQDPVTSPTFTLLQEYTGEKGTLYHLDLYRLETTAAIESAGLDEYLMDPDGVVVVEWMSRWQGPKPDRFRSVKIIWINEDQREIRYEDTGIGNVDPSQDSGGH